MPHTGGVANVLVEELTGMTSQFWLMFLQIFVSCMTFFIYNNRDISPKVQERIWERQEWSVSITCLMNLNYWYCLYSEASLNGAEKKRQLFKTYRPAIFTVICKDSPKPLHEVHEGMSGAGLDWFLTKKSKYLRTLRADIQSLWRGSTPQPIPILIVLSVLLCCSLLQRKFFALCLDCTEILTPCFWADIS